MERNRITKLYNQVVAMAVTGEALMGPIPYNSSDSGLYLAECYLKLTLTLKMAIFE